MRAIQHFSRYFFYGTELSNYFRINYHTIIPGQVGANRKAFGNFGASVALVFDLYVPDRTAWYTKVSKYGFLMSKDTNIAVKYLPDN